MPGKDHSTPGGHRPAGTAHAQALRRRQRLTDPAHFQQAFAGQAFAGRFLVLRVRRGPAEAQRLGVVAGKRALPRSVDRSRAKRLLREAFRLNRAQLAGTGDIVLIARSAIRGATRQEVEADLLKQARRAGLWVALPTPG